MKLYGIKIDKNEQGEKVALIEATREEISTLMMILNTASIKDRECKNEDCEMEDTKYWMQLYDIKYNDTWSE